MVVLNKKRLLFMKIMNSNLFLIGITGFEPAASSSRTKRATKLRYIPVYPFVFLKQTECIKIKNS